MLGCVLFAGSTGCRNRVQNDYYRQRMASEIRVLEDQLYDADYQNRVLHDKVTRLETQSQRVKTDIPSPRSANPDGDRSPQSNQDDPLIDLQELDNLGEMEEMEEFAVPLIDEGVPDEEMPPPNTHRESDPAARDGKRSGSGGRSSGTELLPPPGGPEPPGKDDLKLPEIDQGELLPPASGNAPETHRAGRVMLPESLQAKTKPVPHNLQIHKGLSGGHQFDGDNQVGGMYLVINAIDRRGRPVDLDRFEVEAELTIVALDPTRKPSEARIGRWEFTAAEVKELIRSEPTSGLHVALRWQEGEPNSDDVIVHVRLRAEEEEMRCEGRMKIGTSVATAKWSPRGQRF